MADNTEIQGLEFKIIGDSVDATQSLENLKNTLTGLKSAVKGGVGGINTTAQQISGLKTSLSGLKSVSSSIAKCIKKSNDYQESLNLFTVALGEYANQAHAYGEQVSDALGIDLSSWIKNQGVFNTLLTGFGNTADRAYTMSQNLTQLGYDLSSFFNISVEDSMQKLQSGISGELEPLRRLGYDLSQARLEAVALSLGIDKSVDSMTQAEKAELRYYAIMNQVTSAQGDLARTLDSPANQLRVLQAHFDMCAREIGNIFIPSLNAILPYAIAVVQIIREVASAVAELAGFTLTEVDYSNVGKLGSNAEVIANGFENATNAAKKLKSVTAGFDELNVISQDTDTGIESAGSNGTGFDFELPSYDFLGDAINSRVEEIKTTLESSLAAIESLVGEFALAIGLILVLTGTNIPAGLGLMGLGAILYTKSFGEDWSSVPTSVAESLATISALAAGALFGLGVVMLLAGRTAVGIGLMVAGLASAGSAGTAIWNSCEDPVATALEGITDVLAGGLLAVGALLAFTGADIPMGIAFMVAGAAVLGSSKTINWKSMEDPVSGVLSMLKILVGGAELALGAVLAFTGINVPLGIGLMAIGATTLAAAVAPNWSGISSDVKSVVEKITAIVGVAFLALGAILTFSGGSLVLGIGLLISGALMLANTVSLNWNKTGSEVKKTVTQITAIMSPALLALGGILTFAGVSRPLGIALIAAGAVGLVTTVALNWNDVKNSVKSAVSGITAILSGASLVLGAILCLSGVGIGLGLALIAAGLAGSYAAWSLDDNPLTRFVKKMANGVIGILNRVIKSINEMFHISFKGLKLLGKEVIPPFETQLIKIPTIPTFADGGFVDEGQLFIAREAGAEMVGSMNNRTAVANNDQIVEGIREGVYEAVIAAMSNTAQKGEQIIKVYLDSKEITASVEKHQRERGASLMGHEVYSY